MTHVITQSRLGELLARFPGITGVPKSQIFANEDDEYFSGYQRVEGVGVTCPVLTYSATAVTAIALASGPAVVVGILDDHTDPADRWRLIQSRKMYRSIDDVTWEQVWQVPNYSNNYWCEMVDIKRDRSNPSVLFASIAAAYISTEACEKIALDVLWDGTWQAVSRPLGDLGLVTSVDAGKTWATVSIGALGLLRFIVTTGSYTYYDFWGNPHLVVGVTASPITSSDSLCTVRIAPCHDGTHCYYSAQIRGWQWGGDANVGAPEMPTRHNWIWKTDATGDITDADYFETTGGNYPVWLETDPTNADRLWLFYWDGTLIVEDWATKVKVIKLNVASSGTPYQLNFALAIADDGSVVVPWLNPVTHEFIIKRSTDGGDTWVDTDLTAQISAGSNVALSAAVQLDGTIVIALNRDLLWSQDHGATWTVRMAVLISPGYYNIATL